VVRLIVPEGNAKEYMQKEILIAIIAASSALCGVLISQKMSMLRSFFDGTKIGTATIKSNYKNA
jgi:hypothetical protein